MNKYQFLKRLEKHGYEKLGSGSFSSVWAKPGNSKVLKVGIVANDAWLQYIEWAMSKGLCRQSCPTGRFIQGA